MVYEYTIGDNIKQIKQITHLTLIPPLVLTDIFMQICTINIKFCKRLKDKNSNSNTLTLDQIINIFKDEETLLISKGVFPLISPYKEEVAHFLGISDDVFKKIQAKLLENPLSQFNLNPSKDAQKETFLYVFDQLWSSLHQLSQPLFQIAKHHLTMNVPELMNILKGFSNNVSQYQKSFFIYKNDSFRFNKSNFFYNY